MYKCVFVCFILASCGGIGFAWEQPVVGNYYLIAADVQEQMNITYHDSTKEQDWQIVIESCVYAVGYNDKYLIAKQHPATDGNLLDKTITNYYILPAKEGMDWKSRNGLIGPLNYTQFEKKRKKLGIEEIQFTVAFKKLE